MQMRAVGLKILKNRLSEYVRLAAAGESIAVTDRDRVVAQIIPPSPSLKAAMADPFLARGVREGWLTPPTHPAEGPPPRHPLVPFDELMGELARDREDR
jgi:antitoxin (DNA-binding transcriptional repressor) of toxin-antitoxin stability system